MRYKVVTREGAPVEVPPFYGCPREGERIRTSSGLLYLVYSVVWEARDLGGGFHENVVMCPTIKVDAL